MVELLYDLDESLLQSLGLVTANSIAISYNKKLVGLIDYQANKEYVKIMYITVHDDYRRLGIAGKVITMLKEEHQGKYMYGDSLPGAIKFWESMGAEFHEDPFDDYLTPFSIEC